MNNNAQMKGINRKRGVSLCHSQHVHVNSVHIPALAYNKAASADRDRTAIGPTRAPRGGVKKIIKRAPVMMHNIASHRSHDLRVVSVGILLIYRSLFSSDCIELLHFAYLFLFHCTL